MQSAAEREIGKFIISLRHGLYGHDRAVLAGLALSLVPIPPANLVGILLASLNLLLLATGRLPRREAFLLGISISALGIYCFVWVSLLHFAITHDLPIFSFPKILHRWMEQQLNGSGSAIQAAWTPVT